MDPNIGAPDAATYTVVTIAPTSTTVFTPAPTAANPKPASTTLPVFIPPSLSAWCKRQADASLKWVYVSQYQLNSSDSDGGELVSTGAPSPTGKFNWYKTVGGGDAGPYSDKGWDQVEIGPLVAFDPSREYWSSDDGQRVIVAYIDYQTGATCQALASTGLKVTFNEQVRQTDLTQDLTTLIKPPSLGGGGLYGFRVASVAGVPKPVFCLYPVAYTLSQSRATLAITVTPGNQAVAATGEGTVSANVLTGDAEHFFFTTDVLYQPMASFIDPSGGGVPTEKDVPNNPLIGFNYLIGDLHDPTIEWYSYKRLAIKVLASPDHTKNQYGVSLGYMIPGNLVSTPATGSFMVYATRMRSISSTGNRTERWRWGISYNLATFGSGGSGGGSGSGGGGKN